MKCLVRNFQTPISLRLDRTGILTEERRSVNVANFRRGGQNFASNSGAFPGNSDNCHCFFLRQT